MYRNRIGTPCEALSFQDIADGALPALPGKELPKRNTSSSSRPPPETETQDSLNNRASEDDRNSILQKKRAPHELRHQAGAIVRRDNSGHGHMLLALHLITQSELFALLWQLSTKATWLIIIAPHKKPEVNFAQFTDPITRLKWRIVDRLKMAGDG